MNVGENYNNDTEKDTHFNMHGIKVISKLYDKNARGSGKSPLVLLHGYAIGSLFFYRNLLGLSSHHFNGVVYALDMLGWGLSSRPRFELKEKGQGLDGEVDMTEQFFVESLEAWRKAHNLDKMTLCGHSMGGYFSIAYAEKYPKHVDSLILLSPVGVPHEKKELFDEKGIPWSHNLILKSGKFLWNRGITPSKFVRSLPEAQGRNLVGNQIERKFPDISLEERKFLIDYSYTNFALPASGEDCLNKVFKPFAYAKRPTISRIPYLKVKNVTFIYGENDWMDYTGGLDVHRTCQQLKEAGKNDVPRTKVLTVKDAGEC